MIVGENWVWLHLPKTGGTSVAKHFKELSLPGITIDDQSNDSKHGTFPSQLDNETRAEDGFSKHIFITSRRLPDWLLSDWYHKTRIMHLELPFEPVRSGLFYSLRLGGVWVAADYWLRYFEVERCEGVIRLENLDDDANRFIHPLLPKGTPCLSFSQSNNNMYSRDTSLYFTSTDINRIYTNNPVWFDWECGVYGRTKKRSISRKLFFLPIRRFR